MAGFSGDDGPATAALLNFTPSEDPLAFPAGIVARPDGGFAFPDPGNHRIRAVDSNGIIRTVAGGSRAMLADPIGLAATPDGGYIVTETEGSRVLRIRPDGAIETIARPAQPFEVVLVADGTPIISRYDQGGRLSRLDSGTGRLTPYLRPGRPGDTFDFAAREYLGEGLGLDPHGGLLAFGPVSQAEPVRGRVTYVPNGPTPWTLVALRDMRTTRRALTAVIEATQPGTATLELTRRRHVVARVTQPVPAGHSTLRVTGPIRERWYDARVLLQSGNGAIARDELPIHGARILTVPLRTQVPRP